MHGVKMENCIATTKQGMVEFMDSRNQTCVMKLKTKKLFTLLTSVLIIAVVTVSCKEIIPAEVVREVEELPYYNEPTFTPQWLHPRDSKLQNFHQIGNFELLNQYGEKVTSRTVDGKITVVDFFFTSCGGICPEMTGNMKIVQDAIADDKDVVLLSHTVTPSSDSVSILLAYAKQNGVIKDKWHMLTGDRDEIYELGRKKYFIEEDLGYNRPTDEFLHTENFVLVDQNGFIRGIYNGLNVSSVNELIGDIRTLQN